MTYKDYFVRICNSILLGYYAGIPYLAEVGNLGILSKVTENELEVPFVVGAPLLEKLGLGYMPGNYIIPINVTDYNHYATAKSAAPIFRQFFYDISVDRILTKRIGKDTLYYGGKGIILYRDKTPLVLFSVVLKKGEIINEHLNLGIDRIKVYINPLIYTKDDLMAKAIRGKMLEELCTLKYREAVANTGYRNTRDCAVKITGRFEFSKLEIVVSEDINNWIIKPKVPTINDTNEVLQEYIANNADLIL